MRVHYEAVRLRAQQTAEENQILKHEVITLAKSQNSHSEIFIDETRNCTESVDSKNASFMRMNSRLKEMKHREEQLLDQISQMKSQLKLHSIPSGTNLPTNEDMDTSVMFDHQTTRVGQLEAVIFS